MIFSKKVNIVHAVLALIFLVICTIGCIRINSEFPQVKEVSNKETGYIMFRNLEIRPVEMKLYTVQEFCDQFPNVMEYNYLLANPEHYDLDNTRIVYYKVSAANNTENDIRFTITYAVAASYPHCWDNGIPPFPGPVKVKAGETTEFEGAALCTPLLAGYKDVSELKGEQFYLIFSGYPEKIMLTFD